MFTTKKLLILLFLPLFIIGCGDDAPPIKAETATPEYAATEFFYALYLQKDLKKAIALSDGKMGRIIKNYGSVRAVQRNLLNMPYDEVTITIDKSGTGLRNGFGTEAIVTFMFTGNIHGKRKDDLKSVFMVKQKEKWLVKKIKLDPYN